MTSDKLVQTVIHLAGEDRKWMYLVSTLGPSWHSLQRPLYLLLAFLLLLGAVSAFWIAITLRRVLKLSDQEPKSTTVSYPSMAPIALLKQRGARASKYIGLVLLGCVIGWNARSIRQFNHTYVLNDVRVLKRHSANYYLMQTEHHVDFTFRLCSDSQADLLEGSTLKILVYEERGSCESISDKHLGFIVERDPNTGWPLLAKGD